MGELNYFFESHRFEILLIELFDHGVEHAVKSHLRVADSAGYISELLDEPFIVLKHEVIELLIGDVHDMVGVSTPMDGVLVN